MLPHPVHADSELSSIVLRATCIVLRAAVLSNAVCQILTRPVVCCFAYAAALLLLWLPLPLAMPLAT